jgi:hypothetical protein
METRELENNALHMITGDLLLIQELRWSEPYTVCIACVERQPWMEATCKALPSAEINHHCSVKPKRQYKPSHNSDPPTTPVS